MGSLKIRLNNHLIFYSSFVVLLGTIAIRYVAQVDIPRILFLAVVAIMAIAADRDELLAIPLCCIPLYTSMQYLYAVGICLTVLLIRFGPQIRLNMSAVPVLLIFLWELLHCFDEYSSIMEAIRMFVPFMLLAVLMCLPHKDTNYPLIVRLVAASTIFICVVLLVKVIRDADYNLQVAFLDMQRLGFGNEEEELVGAYLNPNTLGYFCIMASIGLLQLISVQKHHVADIVAVGFLTVCGMLTMSRTFLVCFVLMNLLFIIAKKGTFKEKCKNIGVMILLLAAIALVMWLVFPMAVEAFAERFRVDDISNGRNSLFVQYFERNFESARNAFFGVGAQSLRAKVSAMYGVDALVPHNGVQEVLFVWGLPGLVLFIWIVVEMLRRSKRIAPERQFINFIPLILLLVKVQAGQLATSCYTLLIFSLAYLSLTYVFYQREETAEGETT